MAELPLVLTLVKKSRDRFDFLYNGAGLPPDGVYSVVSATTRDPVYITLEKWSSDPLFGCVYIRPVEGLEHLLIAQQVELVTAPLDEIRLEEAEACARRLTQGAGSTRDHRIGWTLQALIDNYRKQMAGGG